MEINEFDGEYEFLSNFHLRPMKYQGLVYPSSEHAFQAAKADNEADREKIRHAKTPFLAKRYGKKIRMRPGWDNLRMRIMKEILEAKFQDPELRQKLLDTGDAKLVEGNMHNDTFWGVCRGVGKNNLGRLLMEIRAAL